MSISIKFVDISYKYLFLFIPNFHADLTKVYLLDLPYLEIDPVIAVLQWTMRLKFGPLIHIAYLYASRSRSPACILLPFIFHSIYESLGPWVWNVGKVLKVKLVVF